VKKLSGIFKDKPTTPSTPNITLAWYPPARLPRLLFVPIFDIPRDLPPSVEIDNLEHQLSCIDHFIDLVDMICEDDSPIGLDSMQHEQPEESAADLLAKRLWAHFEFFQ